MGGVVSLKCWQRERRADWNLEMLRMKKYDKLTTVSEATGHMSNC